MGTESLFPLIVVFLGIAGLMTGSFLNVVIDRLPQGRSLIHPRSHCDECGHPLARRDLVPVFSFIWLQGRCRYCRVHLSRRMPLVELATGIVFALLPLGYGLSLPLVMSIIYAALLIPLFVIDLEQGLLPDRIVFPGMGLALGFSFLWPEMGPWNSLLGGAVGSLVLFIPYLLTRGGMGLGDVKLAGLLGLAGGFPAVLVALLLAFITGGVVAAGLLAWHKKGLKDPIPFGPFLVTAGFIALLWGKPLIQWYLELF